MRTRLFAPLLAALAMGCTNAADAYSLAEWQEDLLDAECARLARVPTRELDHAVAGALPRAECIEALRALGVDARLRVALEHPDYYAVDPSAADACLEAIASDRFERWEIDGDDACADVVVWRAGALGAEAGDPCQTDIGCAPGLACEGADASGCGECVAVPERPRQGEGWSCAADLCREDLECSTGESRCRPVRAESAIAGAGEACGRVATGHQIVITECTEGLACMRSAFGGAVCTRLRALGEACVPLDVCEPGAFCIDGACARPSYVPEHGRCDARPDACALDQECICATPGPDCARTCERLAALGEPCGPNGEGDDRRCEAGLRCSGSACVELERAPVAECAAPDAA